MMSLFTPWVVGILGALGAHSYGVYPKFSDAAAVAQFAGTLASIAATMLGFMLAALAVIASINNTHLVTMMRKTGHYLDLLKTLFVGCLLFLWIAVAGLTLVFGVEPGPWFLSMLMGLHLAALLSLLDIGRKFWLVLANIRS